jgi:predicted GTPase
METTTPPTPRRVLILGAAGRDFHVFNVLYRDRADATVAAFTATQIPYIDDRAYPPALAGRRYPHGIPIHPESDLEALIRDLEIDEALLAYSDLSHEDVMHLASRVLAAGAAFTIPGAHETMLPADVPVVSVCAVRTGVGKSAASRRVAAILREEGLKPVAVRHPMPYGDLVAARVQRFAAIADVDAAGCTVEEREEIEPHLEAGTVVYQGVDYADILAKAQKEADVLIWDGGNNDLPFYRPDLHIVLVDPLRPGHETRYHPGETNLRMADAILINKVDSADPADVAAVEAAARAANPHAVILHAASPPVIDRPDLVHGARVLIIEDGPTLTHGGMGYGAGFVAARNADAAAVVDPRRSARGTLKPVLDAYPDVQVLPAMGYGKEQLADLEATIAGSDCDAVVLATPADLRRLIHIEQPVARVTYDLEERGSPTLRDVLSPVVQAARG